MADELNPTPVPEKETVQKEERIKLTGTWELVKKSWEVFKNNWKGYVLYQLLALAGLVLPMIALIVVFFKDNLSEIGSYMNASGDVDPEKALELMKNFITNPVAIVLIIIIFVASGLINLGYAKYVYQRFVGKDELNIKDSLKYAVSNFLSYLWVSILVGLSVLGGIILLVIPGFIFIIWFVLFTGVFIAEDLRGVAVLSRSKELVKGYFWPVAGKILLFFVTTSAIDNLLTKASEVNDGLLFLIIPIQVAFSFVVSVVGMVFIYQIYQELKLIKKS